MRERLERFMQGRYGVDQLAQFMNIFLLILIINYQKIICKDKKLTIPEKM